MNRTQTHVLVSPLDWGLGHASRCIPVIHSLIKQGCKVSVAGSGRSLQMLKDEFPVLDFFNLSSFSPQYSSGKLLILKLLTQFPSFVLSIISEHFELRKIVRNNLIDIIISDNRYGIWSRNHKSVIITHQLMVKMPFGLHWAERIFHRILRLFLLPFDAIWIPDNEYGQGLSGDLSHKYKVPSNALFIGCLSRFTKNNLAINETDKSFDIVAIVSGAEPQRTIFENILSEQLVRLELKSALVAGKPEIGYSPKQNENMLYIPYLSGTPLAELIKKSKIVISRSGYSSLMDLAALNAKSIVIPTPGQTEQEYLAELLAVSGKVFTTTQNSLDIAIQFEEASKVNGFEISTTVNRVDEAILQLLQRVKSEYI